MDYGWDAGGEPNGKIVSFHSCVGRHEIYGLWTYGLWAYGLWAYGCMDLWMHGQWTYGLWDYGCTDLGMYGCRGYGPSTDVWTTGLWCFLLQIEV